MKPTIKEIVTALASIKASLFIWGSMIIGELHTLAEKSTWFGNWIINDNKPMSLQWNIKYAGEEIQGLFIAMAFFFYTDNKFNRTTAKSVVFYYIIDTLFYFYNYKLDGYGWTYTLTLIAWILIYNYGGRSTTTVRPGITFETQR